MTEKKKPGLYANIHAKQERIKSGSGEHMRKAGSEGAPSDEAFKAAAGTEKSDKDDKPAKAAKASGKAAASKTSKTAKAAKKSSK